MKSIARKVLTCTLCGAISLSAMSLDLPVKRIGGVDRYYYAVKKGDTVFSIAKALGISREEIVRYNPSAADGIRQGATLYFPVSAFSAQNEASHAAAPATRPVAGGRIVQHKVERGETLFGLSHQYGVSAEDIVALNPGANDGIKAGEILRIPNQPGGEEELSVNQPQSVSAPVEQPQVSEPQVEPEAEPEQVVTPVFAGEGERRMTPINPPLERDDDEEGEKVNLGDEPIERRITPVNITPVFEAEFAGSIAVMLPLNLKDETVSRQSRLSTEFVRGIVLGAEKAGLSGDSVKIEIFDTEGNRAVTEQILKSAGMRDFDMIVGPDDMRILHEIIENAPERALIFNILAVQDTSYLHDDRVIQANIPHSLMYAKALQGLRETYEEYTPVFLICKGGQSEKIAFTEEAKQYFTDNNIGFEEISYEGMLSASDLDATLDPSRKYVFIPASGSLGEFNKFARALASYREGRVDPSEIALFGYPDWLIFRNDAAEMLHRLEATFYSRFYSDETSAAVRDFKQAYALKFHEEPMSTVPSQAMLGYDTARFLVETLRNSRNENDEEVVAFAPRPYTGLQSSFVFEETAEDEEYEIEENTPGVADEQTDTDSESGDVNEALYLITYLTGNGVTVRLL